MTPIEEKIQAAIQEAQAICDDLGAKSGACAVAWDTVEELQAEAGHQKVTPPKTPFETYCNDHPDALECRIYED